MLRNPHPPCSGGRFLDRPITSRSRDYCKIQVYKRAEGDSKGKYLPEKVTAENTLKKLLTSSSRSLNDNPAIGGRKVWPLTNSLNQVFAWIEQRAPTGQYDLRNPFRANQIIVYDSNGDATFDPGEDRDMDMRLDVEEDTNNNGILDPGEDTNNNGRLDPSEDVDGDGRLDNAEDLNGDGVLQVGADLELGRSAYGRFAAAATARPRSRSKAEAA